MIYDKTCGLVRLKLIDTPGEPNRAEVEVVTPNDTGAYGILVGMRLEDLRDLRYLIDRAMAAKGASA